MSVTGGLLQAGGVVKRLVGNLCTRCLPPPPGPLCPPPLPARSLCGSPRGPAGCTEVFGRWHRPVSPPSDPDATCPALFTAALPPLVLALPHRSLLAARGHAGDCRSAAPFLGLSPLHSAVSQVC